MNLGKINIISPPDRLFNTSLTYFLIKPSTKVKTQFQQILSHVNDEINVYIYDTNESNIEWMLSVVQSADCVVIDLDNCDPMTKNFMSLLIAQPNVYYLTSDEITPWQLISRNRVYNLDWIVAQLAEDDDDFEDDDDGDYE